MLTGKDRFKANALKKWLPVIAPIPKPKLTQEGKANVFVKELIKNATEAELIFRDVLTDNSIIFEFQKPIHSKQRFYIVDFYIECKRKKLAIELDGYRHFTKEGAKKDKERTLWLHQKGITVLRFANNEIYNRLPMIIAEILTYKPSVYK